MIETIVAELLLFYPEVDSEHLKIERNEYDDQSYEISEEGKEIPFLFVELNHGGELESFSIDDDYFFDDQILSKEAILKKVTEWVALFHADEQEALYLSTMIDFDEQWWIDFIRKDPYLGLELPNSGTTIHIKKNGVIMSADIELQSFRIEEPTIIISAEEAKKLYLEQLLLTPAIMKFSTDYVGGDDAYHLVYYVEDFVMWIGTDGELHTIETFGVKRPQYEALLPTQNNSKGLYEIIGVPADFTKLSDEQTDEGRLEVWSNQPVIESEYAEENVMEIYFNEENQVRSLNYLPNVDEQHLLNKDVGEALERAIEFLRCQCKDGVESFRLLKEEHELYLYDDEGESEEVYAYQFNFQWFERGMIVEGANILIEVDSRNLMIINVDAEAAIQLDLSGIAVDCIFPVEKVQEIYVAALEMETSWSKEIDENPITYKLNYLPAFPATNGHMRAIDANTGKPWIIDTSWIEFES